MSMKRNWIIGIVVSLVLVSLASSCDREEKFEVTGQVAGANGKTLYLEQETLGSASIVDSVVLGKSGEFRFRAPLPEYPEYFRLRLDKQQIPFAIDSLHSQAHFTTDAQSFATGYQVSGNEPSEQIREIWLANLDANLSISRLSKSQGNGNIGDSAYVASVDSVLSAYKELATKYIFNAPGSSPAYYALFQQVNGQLIFNLYSPEDSKAFAAVANVMNSFYPNSPRTKHLYDLALRSIAVIRKARAEQASRAEMAESVTVGEKVREIGYFDFSLPQIDGTEVHLSHFADGHPTLLSFTTMSATWAGQYNQLLKEVHEQYAARGLRIYQVGLDSDSHIWRNSVASLPWTNVQDKNGLYSELVGLYNIQALPTIYLLNREGEIVSRVVRLEELTALIEQIL